MQKRLFVYTFLSVITGILAGTLLPCGVYISVAIILVAPLFIFFKRRIILALSVFCLGISMLSSSIQSLPLPDSENIHKITGRVSSIVAYDEESTVILENASVDGIKGKHTLSVTFENQSEFSEGDIISFSGTLYRPSTQKANPSQMPPRFTALADGISYYVTPEESTSVLVLGSSFSIRDVMSRFRIKVRNVIFYNIHNTDSATVLYAMLSGDKSFIPASVAQSFSLCGTSHLLAVSGLHVGIILSLVLALLKKLRLKPLIIFICTAVFLTFYCAFTDFTPSVIRAAIMALWAFGSKSRGMRYDSLNSMAFAGTVILMFDPFALFDLSFILSFAACFGIIAIKRPHFKNKILDHISSALALTVGATLFTMPITACLFGTFTPVAFIANLLLVPVASIALLLLFIFCIIALLVPPLAFCLKAPGFIMELILGATEFLSKAPYVTFGAFSIILGAVILGIMIFFTRFHHMPARLKRISAAVLLLVFTLTNLAISLSHLNQPRLIVPAARGNGIYAHVKNRENYVFGICEDERGLEDQISYIKRAMPRIDILVAFSDEQIKNLHLFSEACIEIDKLYITKNVTPNKEARLYGVEILDEVMLFNGSITYSSGGAILNINGKSVYVQTSDPVTPSETFYMAVTLDEYTHSDTAITKNTVAKNCKKYYDIMDTGYVSIPIRRSK